MKVLRLICTQRIASFRKEGADTNRMTYPLPPPSTVIGALHKACGYNTYHPMDVSIQGDYTTMHNKIMIANMKFNQEIMTDRGKLVKLAMPGSLSSSYTIIAETAKGGKLKERKNVQVYDEPVYQEVLHLLEEKARTGKAPGLECFATIEKELHHEELLNDLYLIIYIKTDENTLVDIKNNAYQIRCFGRSEDMIDLLDARFVDLREETLDDEEIVNHYHAYVDYDIARSGRIYFQEYRGSAVGGTRYLLDKDYKIVDEKRVFNKVWALYASQFAADEFGNGLYVDDDVNGQKLIVSFL